MTINKRGSSYEGLLRFNTNGTLDNSFASPLNYYPDYRQLKVMPNNQILVVEVGTDSYIRRLNTNGSLDNTFNSPGYYASIIYSIGYQSDNKVLLSFNDGGISSDVLYRLNADGSPDNSFTPVLGVLGNVILQQPDGKILAAGPSGVIRVEGTGDIDPTFTAINALDGDIIDMVIQSNGKIVLVGTFTRINGFPTRNIARLNSDGSIDTGFLAGNGFSLYAGAQPNSLKLLASDNLLVAGEFASYNDETRNRLLVLNADGSLQCSFDPQVGPNGSLADAAVQSDGKILIVGGLTNYEGTSRNAFARVNNTTTLVPNIISFAPTFGPIGTTVTISGTNFNTTPANNTVYFGATRATVTAATATQLTVTVPVGATYQPISVLVNGLVGYSEMPFIVSFASGAIIDACAFAPKVDFATGTSPLGLAVADFDGDGKVDIAVTNRTTQTLALYRNTSTTGTINTSSLGSPINLPTLTDPYSATAVDIDGDGKLDIAVTNAQSATLSLYRNTSTTGTLSFEPKVDFVAGNNPLRSAYGDLDGDGKPELVVANRFSNRLGVYKNLSSSGPFSAATFAAPVNFVTGSEPYNVAIGDLNGDGKPELIAVNHISNSVSVYQNVSTVGTINASSFATAVNFTAGINPHGIELADIDGDDQLDLVVSNLGGNSVSIFRNLSLTNISSGSFSPKVDFATGSGPYLLAIADYNGDAKLDIAVSSSVSNTISIFRNNSTSGSITGTSLATKVDFISGALPLGVSTADIDGDGKPEIITGNHNNNSLSIFRNVVGSILAPTITSFNPTAGPVGTSVTITGTNFTTPFNNLVRINGVTATIGSSTPTTLTVTIPPGATSGPFEITIGCSVIFSTTNFIVGTLLPT
ncbi:MAG: FG-GAP-like repeat-containing protein, partial [Flammeovirgaceae bacterium]